jgi:hypothetical protein
MTLRVGAGASTTWLQVSRSKQRTETEGKKSSPTQVHGKLCYFYCGSYYFYLMYRIYLSTSCAN